jgi:hypothetical protein
MSIAITQCRGKSGINSWLECGHRTKMRRGNAPVAGVAKLSCKNCRLGRLIAIEITAGDMESASISNGGRQLPADRANIRRSGDQLSYIKPPSTRRCFKLTAD